MTKTFVVDRGVEIVQEEVTYDLHNNYAISGIAFISEGDLVVIFNQLKGKGSLLIRCVGLDYIAMSICVSRASLIFIDEVGYKDPSDNNDEWLMTEEQASSKDHLYFRLEGGGYLRFHCESCRIDEIDVTAVKNPMDLMRL